MSIRRLLSGILLILSTLFPTATLLAQKTTVAAKEVKTLWQPYYIMPHTGQRHISANGEWDLGYRDTPINSLSDLSTQQEQIRAQVPDSVQWSLYRTGKLPVTTPKGRQDALCRFWCNSGQSD